MATELIQPDRPPMLYITPDTPPTTYLLGNTTFTGGNFHILNVFQRELTEYDDFILGVLSVMLIAVLSETVQIILLRSTNRKISASRIVHAFLITEAAHFRNVFSHVWRRQPTTRSQIARNGICTSLVVLLLAATIFAADVVIVVLTQPTIKTSAEQQYTLRPVQPSAVEPSLSANVYSSLVRRTCITPVMQEAHQRRRFVLVTCMKVEEQLDDLSESEFASDDVSISSWLHIAGSDHNISFGGGRWIYIKMRAQVIMDMAAGGARHLLFHINDTDSFIQTRYLQSLVVHFAKKWTCQSEIADGWCATASSSTEPTSWNTVSAEIQLWSPRNNRSKLNVTGVESMFKGLAFPAPAQAIRAGMYPLVTSGAVMEMVTVNHSVFTRVVNDSDYRDGADGLIEEEGRPVGVALLGFLFLLFALIMMGLRFWLRPVPLGVFAVRDVVPADEQHVFVPCEFGRCTCTNVVVPSRRDDAVWDDYAFRDLSDERRDHP